jgi:AraC-like DNA-binding protein
MFSMRYYSPAPALRPYLSSYYVVEFAPGRVADTMRAELPNVRFLINGKSTLTWPDGTSRPGLKASLFGARCEPLGLVLDGPGKIFGAGIMPLGWAAFFGIDADRLSDQLLPLGDVVGPTAEQTFERMAAATCDAGLVAAADAFFAALARSHGPQDDWFQALVGEWLIGGGREGVDGLVDEAALSARQVERLCRRYYGAPPKLLLRKYRALRAAVKYSVDPAASWLDAAGDEFYDQSHFIREFKTFVGVTPTQFAKNGAAVMSHSIRLRRNLPTLPRLSLVS